MKTRCREKQFVFLQMVVIIDDNSIESPHVLVSDDCITARVAIVQALHIIHLGKSV